MAGGSEGLAGHAAAASLPGVGPGAVRSWVARFSGTDVWARLRDGRLVDEVLAAQTVGTDLAAVRRRLVAAVARFDAGGGPTAWWDHHTARGVRGAVLGTPDYPVAVAEERTAPGVLFWRGQPAVLDAPRVTVVGTRQPSAVGLAVAEGLGHDLAAAGVVVVSGLALGIDGAAHHGVLRAIGAGAAAAPVAVVGSGVDRPYPRRHTAVWERVVEAGVVLSEVAPGGAPEAWRFPQRNRLLAALGAVTVVVESRHAGGSLRTVDEAAKRGRPVLAVPGSVQNPAAQGTNQLLVDGCAPARDALDVLAALALATAGVTGPAAVAGRRGRSNAGGSERPQPRPDAGAGPPRPSRHQTAPSPEAQAVLALVAGGPVDVDVLAARTSLPPTRLAGVLLGLEQAGLVRREGAWVTAAAAP